MKKTFSSIMLALILIGALTLAFNVQSARASGTIYVRSDGSVDPETAPIQRIGDYYTFTGNIYDSIVVERDNIVIDGADYTLQGTGNGTGIKLAGRLNVAIKNTHIKNFDYGILLYASSNNSISGNNIAKNRDGIRLVGSSNNSISENNITENNRYGILLGSSSNNSISGNRFTYNGLFVWDSYQNSVEDNTVNGRPLVYLECMSNYTVDDAGHVVLVRCQSITVEGLDLSRATAGIELWETSHSTISGNKITNNDYGIYLYASLNNSILGNNITNNAFGIILEDSQYNSISENNIVENTDCGIYVAPSLENKIYHNNFIDNAQHVYCEASSINVWDDGYPSGGNYWSNYVGVDLYSGPYQNITGSDGVGDASYAVNASNVDRYPLASPFRTFDAGTWNGATFNIDIVSNSTVSDFKFDVAQKRVIFNVSGIDGTKGFCRVAIPRNMLWAEDGWVITVGDQPITNYKTFSDENFTYIHFTYNHSTKKVTIQGTHVIPEFTSTIILALFVLATLTATIPWRTKRKHQPP